jgi:hypothetical protein
VIFVPNGGVPINLEMWPTPLSDGSFLIHQQGHMLRLLHIENVSDRTHTVVCEIAITQPFLRNVVNGILGVELNSDVLPYEGAELRVSSHAGRLEIVDDKKGVEVILSGEVLRVLAGFMAYWVDHEGVLVSRELPISYGLTASDMDGVEWTLNWAF